MKCQDVERRGTGNVHFSKMTFHDQPKRSGKSTMNFHQVCERDPRKIKEHVEEIKRCIQILACRHGLVITTSRVHFLLFLQVFSTTRSCFSSLSLSLSLLIHFIVEDAT